MLNQMLRLLGDGGIHATADLARRLGVSEDLARLMAEDLTRRGYLIALGDGCSTVCDNCALSNACGTAGSSAVRAPLLALTAKGRQACHLMGNSDGICAPTN